MLQIWTKSSKGAFTPDTNEANKSRYSRVVGRLNILSLLASFVREIHYTTDANSRHGRGFCQAERLVAKCIPVFVKVRNNTASSWLVNAAQISAKVHIF